MRHLRLRGWYKAAIVLAVVVSFNSSCKKDEVILPDYAGTWVAVESVPTESGFKQVKDIMTFTETSFSNIGQIQTSTDKWVSMASMDGSLSVYGDIMSVTVTEVGVSSISGVDGQPTGVITSYKKGTSEFDILIDEMEQPKTFESKFSVTGDQLTLQTDQNDDGDYLDALETTVYTKQ